MSELKRAWSDLHRKMGKRYSHENTSLEKYRVYHPDQTKALAAIREFIAKIGHGEPRGLVIYGTVGTGKDYLLAATLYAAIKAGSVSGWVNGQDLYQSFRDGMDTQRPESATLAEFTRPDILGISDPIPPVFDASKQNAWRAELLYRVLDARYRRCCPTWVSVNAKSPEDADAKLSEPVFDRLQHNALMIPCFWTSYRERKS